MNERLTGGAVTTVAMKVICLLSALSLVLSAPLVRATSVSLRNTSSHQNFN